MVTGPFVNLRWCNASRSATNCSRSMGSPGSFRSTSRMILLSPEEIVEFFEWRFDDLICRFSASFDDSCVRIGKPFSDAAREAMCKGPGGSKSYEDA